MSEPKRIQRQRTTGWRMPEGVVYVGRPSKWGNPFAVGDPNPWEPYGPMDAAQAVEAYRYAMDTGHGRALIRTELAGKDLACWCPLGSPCHANVLLRLANEDTDRG